jgi:hypothetical protein
MAAGSRDSDHQDGLRRLAWYSLLLALAVALLSAPAYFAAFGWDVEAAIFGHPSAVLSGGAGTASLLRWGAVGDMFYSYLLLAPLALFVHRHLRPRRPWLADLGTAAAFAYIVAGAAGAAILAGVGPPLVEAYAAAPPAERVAIAGSFEVLRGIVYFGLWQTLDPITAGTWVLSVGALLLTERRLVGRFLVIAGVGLMALSGMTMLGVHSLPVLLGTGAAVLGLWLAWIVIDRVRP